MNLASLGLCAALGGAPLASTAAAEGCGLSSKSSKKAWVKALDRSWRGYVERFVQDDGRVIDHAAGGISTSEGQAYALLRAAWSDDRATFDSVLRWTRDNMQGGDPGKLPAWKWGKRDDNSWGVLDEQPASDADQWMAYALLIAADQWDDARYRRQARAMLSWIWAQEVLTLPAGTVLLPGPWAAAQRPIKINPSYYLPFAYRRFAAEDPDHPWMALVQESYRVFNATMHGGKLPADWILMDPDSGSYDVTDAVFGFEAFRIAWTLAAEVAWYDSQPARELLVTFAALGPRWREEGWIPAIMRPDHTPTVNYDNTGLYGALLPAWAYARPEDAAALFDDELDPLHSKQGWGRDDDYYAHNWTWIGVALWQGLARPPEEGQ